MRTVQIGQTDVITTKLGLGTNKVGGRNLFGKLELFDNDGRELVKAALDNGVTLLDTAFVYGLGRSEELIAEVLKDYDRSKVVLATKAAHDPQLDLKYNNTPAFLIKSVDDALQRLHTDYLDIFYIHFPDETTPKSEAVGALQKLKESGKIRAIGLSNFNLEQIKEANVDGYVDVVEDEYSLVNRAAETTLFPYLADHNISFVPYYPLASGLLTGKYQENQVFSPDDWQYGRTNFEAPWFAKILAAVDMVKPIAAKHEATVAQVLLAWYMQNPAITTVIPGARLASQVVSNVKSTTITLTSDEYQLINQAFAF